MKEKKYTEDHEWIEASADGKTCTFDCIEAWSFLATSIAIALLQNKDRMGLKSSPDTLGISEYAAKALGDVVYIELPEVDLEVSEGDAIGAVESVKSASDILTPVSGTVAEVNSALEQKPGNVNVDPEGDFWIAKINVSEEPAGKLMSESEYKAFTEEA